MYSIVIFNNPTFLCAMFTFTKGIPTTKGISHNPNPAKKKFKRKVMFDRVFVYIAKYVNYMLSSPLVARYALAFSYLDVHVGLLVHSDYHTPIASAHVAQLANNLPLT